MARPAASAPSRPKKSDPFEIAVLRATSHEQPKPKTGKRPQKRLSNTLSLIATFVVIGSFIGYLNLPGISLRVASFHAGFSASLPGYIPTGYALDDVKRTGGTVSLSFASGENRLTIVQQASNWDSQTLVDNTLALTGTHQSIQKNGQTVFIYDDSTGAAWVNAGIRYDLSSNARLSTAEIANIAANF